MASSRVYKYFLLFCSRVPYFTWPRRWRRELIGVASVVGIQTFSAAVVSREETLSTKGLPLVQHHLQFLSPRNQCKKSHFFL